LLELIELINSKIGGLNNEYKVLSPIFHPSRQGDIVRSCASIELVKKDFNWSPTVSIENGIGELIIHIEGD
jgi:nucleoside-diphosphate-sugar epimerase